MNKEFQVYYKANAIDHVAKGVKIVAAKSSDAALEYVRILLAKDYLQIVELICSLY